jgi:hypothetical protein
MAIQHGFDKLAIILGHVAQMSVPVKQPIFGPLPLVVP